ncbi:claspin-like isoform X2 [Lutzomyia longipalpis]|nr:claspin-like isoform X2 [Lutzomyia longipalpis]
MTDIAENSSDSSEPMNMNGEKNEDSPHEGEKVNLTPEAKRIPESSDDENSDDCIGFSRIKKRVQILSDKSDDDDTNGAIPTSTPDDQEAIEGMPGKILGESKIVASSASETEDVVGEVSIIGQSERYNNLKVLCDEDSSAEEYNEEEKEINVVDLKENERPRKQKKTKSKKRSKTEVVEESASSEESEDEENELPKNAKKKRNVKKVEKPRKLTKHEKEKELAERNEVYSMIQKNAREEVIEVPYHKPEQYDIKEFLSRLQKSKIDLPTDKKLAKKTGKLRALKTDKKMTLENEKLNHLQKESLAETNFIADEEKNPKIDSTAEKDPESHFECPDEIDILVSGPSDEKTNTPQAQNDESSAKRLILRGDPGSLIDLESGLVHQKPKSKEISLIEKCILQNAKTSAATVDNIKIEHSPGIAYKILKESLEQELLQKKREQIQRYLESQEREKFAKIANEIDDEKEFADSDGENEEENEEVDKESEENEEVGKESEEDKEPENQDNAEEIVPDEAEHEEDNNCDVDEIIAEENEAEDEDSDGENELSEGKKKYRKRIVSMNDEESEDEEKDCEVPIPDSVVHLPDIVQDTSITESQMEKDEMELFNLCTGNFNTQPVNPTEMTENKQDDDRRGSQENTQNDVPTVPDFESSDEENIAKSSKNVKKKIPRVYLSDEEEQNEENSDEITDKDSNNDENEENSEIPELSEQEEDKDVGQELEYDSEENEVDLPAKPKIKITDFVENEAELSESEWGSADEDEKDLDKLEIELGDEDQFDQEQLQSELERIHMKKLLDQDAREVKMVKNLVLHEEEREGMIRERTFRWLHVDNDFNLNSDKAQENGHDDTRQSDEENEEEWRKIRHERDVVLKDKLSEELSEMFEMKNVTILKPTIPEDPREVKAPTFLVPEMENHNRKSLLLQDDEYLARLANIASKTSDVLVNGATEKGSFVFRQMAKQEDSDQ